MAFKWRNGKTILREYPRKTSTAFSKDSLVYFASGVIAPATATSGDHAGVCIEVVASTDSDYATAGVPIQIEVPCDKQCVLEADVSGTLATTSVGVTYDLLDSTTVNQAGTSKNVVTCIKFISTAKGQFVLNATFDVYRVA